jgi:uncharacterized protein involved in exopolysaccharide biosynthesis
MSRAGVRTSTELTAPDRRDAVVFVQQDLSSRERQAAMLRLLWDNRRLLLQAAGVGLLSFLLIALLIPSSYVSTARLMPPDSQSGSGLAMMAAMAASKSSGPSSGNLAGMASDLLGMKSTGAMFIGVLRSETSENSIIQQFDLQKVYGIRLLSDTRKKLDDNTAILEDRKSGIIAISVTDHSPQRAAAIANGYVDELNSLVAQLSTSAAHRERVFLEDRLKVAKQELDTATNQLAQFSSKNTTLDMQTEGKAMLDAASVLTGQLIVAQSELQGLRQIYTDNNPRVRALNGRVGELRKQLEKLGGTQESTQTDSAQDDASASGQSSNSTSGNVSGSPFPTIHNLPLLGAKYSDYYRRAKIQETVFELLTTQYELAKVQEAKETPSVKVLDPGRVPDRKSFPPRLLITVFGAMTAMAVMALWVLANNRWTQVDPADPRKLLALEVAATFRANSPWTSPNGDAPEPWVRKVWRRLGNLFPPANGPSAS